MSPICGDAQITIGSSQLSCGEQGTYAGLVSTITEKWDLSREIKTGTLQSGHLIMALFDLKPAQGIDDAARNILILAVCYSRSTYFVLCGETTVRVAKGV